MMNTQPYADLEIRILEHQDAGYPVEITLNPGQYYKQGFLDLALHTGDDARQTGARLFEWLFTDTTLREAWEYARGQHPQRRIRLRLDADAPELHTLPWESLRDPAAGLDLTAADATPFSRFLAGTWTPGSPVLTRPIKMLVAIADPCNLSDYNLAALEAQAEWDSLLAATKGLDVTLTPLPQPCTLQTIEAELRRGYHVLHLIAHGAYNTRRKQATLYLADDANQVTIVPEDDFAAMLKRQLADNVSQDAAHLRLVFLASCESAVRDTADAFRGLAPALVNAGVPAIVAMQDSVSITAAREFSRTFYGQLLQHGLVDLAGNQARATLLTAGSSEAATPVVFMRLNDGQLFQTLPDIRQTIQQRYPFLEDYVYDVATTIETVTQWFVGREFVFDWLEAQLRAFPCGYLRLVADAGLGKTAIAAEVARHYGALVHFVNASQGVTRPDQCLNHLAASLIARYNLPHDHLPERARLGANFLQTVLQEAADRRRDAPVLLVIDALDEADPVSAGRNWLHLPDHLPQGIYVLLTHRPGDYPVAADAQTPQPEPLIIAWDDPRQQDDIAVHLRRQAERPEIHRALAEATPPIAIEQFVAALQTAAEGNFKYLDYVLADIAAQEPGFDPLNVQGLPRGLHGYYAHFWAQIEQVKGQEGWAEWKGLYRPVIELLGVAGEPVTAEWLATHTGHDAAVRTPDEIEERALARWVRFLHCERRSEGVRTWRIIHSSFSDFLAEKVDLPAAHRRVAKYYLDAWGGWEAGLPNLSVASEQHGGYGLRHLAEHLNGAQWWEPLHALFASDVWMQACVVANGYIYDGYLNDMYYAWQHAEFAAQQPIVEDTSLDALAECVRYALIRTTINSLASNYEPELVVHAVKLGLWSAARALSVSARMPEYEQRAKMYTLLLERINLNTIQRQTAQNSGLSAARAIGSERERVKALASLAPLLTGESRQSALMEGLKTLREIENESDQVYALAALAPKLTDAPRMHSLLEEGITIAQAVEDDHLRVEALAAMVPQLVGETRECVLAEGLAIALEIEDYYWRVKAIVALLPQLSGQTRERILAAGLAAARDIENEWSQASALISLAPHLTGEARERVLADALVAAQMIKTEMQQLQASGEIGKSEGRAILLSLSLANLVPQLSGELLTMGLAIAREIKSSNCRPTALKAFIPELTGKIQEEVLTEWLTAIRVTENGLSLVKSLVALAKRLTGKTRTRVLTEALEAALEIKWSERSEALGAVIPYLTGEAREYALEVGLTTMHIVQDKWQQVSALVALAPYLTGQVREQILAAGLAAAQDIEYAGHQAEAMVALAPQLSGELLAACLAAVQEIEGKQMFTAKFLYENDIEECQVSVLAALAPKLQGKLLTAGLAMAQGVVGWGNRAEALIALAPQLAGDVREAILAEAFTGVRGISSKEDRVKAYATLASLSKGDTRERALAKGLAEAREIRIELYQVDAFIALLPHLTGETRESVLAEALAKTRKLEGGVWQDRALKALVPYLTEEEWQTALAVIREIEEDIWRTSALTALASHMTGQMRQVALSEGVASARMITSEDDRVEAFVALVSQLKGETRESVLEEALRVAQKIEEGRSRVRALAALAPYLTGETQERAVEEGMTSVRSIDHKQWRAEGFARMLPYFSSMKAQAIRREYSKAILTSLRTTEHQDRNAVLYILADKDIFNPDLLDLTPETISHIAKAVIDICQQWEWL